jgi:hypothetical protein
MAATRWAFTCPFHQVPRLQMLLDYLLYRLHGPVTRSILAWVANHANPIGHPHVKWWVEGGKRHYEVVSILVHHCPEQDV